ncbi:MAG: hypothetical protein WCS15_11610 [Prevotella sp.]
MAEVKVNGYLGLKDQLGVGSNIYKAAYSEGRTLSQHLEILDPSTQYVGNDAYLGQLDAYERQMLAAGIRTKSDPAKGMYADTVEKFFLGTSSSDVLFPEFINRTARMAMEAPDILNELVAIKTPITGNAYKTFYVDLSTASKQKKRVAQGAEIPTTTITGHEHSVTLNKKGRAIDMSYEYVRRIRIDMLALLIEGILQQTGLDLAEDAVNVLITGDGNASTAATPYTLTGLGGEVANGIDWETWLKFRLKFYPYKGITAIVDDTQLIKVLGIQPPVIDPLTLMAAMNGGTPIGGGANLAQNVFSGPMRYVYLPSATIADKVLVIDPKYALEQVTEIGADIVETDKMIKSQFETIVLSQVTGFATLFPDVVKTLTTNA